MTDEPFTTPGHRIPPRQPKPGQRLFTFVRGSDQALMACELRDHGEYGCEAQFLERGELLYARTFPLRALAVPVGGTGTAND